MLAYQRQNRILRTNNNEQLLFPNKVALQAKINFSEVFGFSGRPSTLAIHGRNVEPNFDASNGRVSVKSSPPLDPLNIPMKFQNMKFVLMENRLNAEVFFEKRSELLNCLMTLEHLLPAYLNVFLHEIVTVTEISGQVGDVSFNFEYEMAGEDFLEIMPEQIEERIRDAFRELAIVGQGQNLRLTASLYYFSVASRLKTVGQSPWEFMVEIILNLTKALEILFRRTTHWKDEIRNGLKELGYSGEEVERKFIPLIELRSNLDIAHPKITVPDHRQLQTLYEYLAVSSGNFYDLYGRLFRGINEGYFALPQTDGLVFDKEDQKGFDRIIESIKSSDTEFFD